MYLSSWYSNKISNRKYRSLMLVLRAQACEKREEKQNKMRNSYASYCNTFVLKYLTRHTTQHQNNENSFSLSRKPFGKLSVENFNKTTELSSAQDERISRYFRDTDLLTYRCKDGDLADQNCVLRRGSNQGHITVISSVRDKAINKSNSWHHGSRHQ